MVSYHDKDIVMLKLGCTLPNLANICLHKSTDVEFYPFTKGDKNLLKKFREDVVSGPSIVFTRSRLTPRQNKTRSFENMVMSYFQRTRPDCEIESFYTTGRQKKIDCFSVDGFCSHCNTVFEAMGCFYHFCPCQELRPSLTEEDIKRGSGKRELNELRRGYI